MYLRHSVGKVCPCLHVAENGIFVKYPLLQEQHHSAKLAGGKTSTLPNHLRVLDFLPDEGLHISEFSSAGS